MSAQPIETLLHRRTDLSTFIVHFTRRFAGESSKDNLISIVSQSTIEARTAFGMGKNTADEGHHSSIIRRRFDTLLDGYPSSKGRIPLGFHCV